MTRLLLVLASIVVLALGLSASPAPARDAASNSNFQGARLVQVAHRRHAHPAGHHKRHKVRSHRRRA
jgi:hypothetical protein